MWDLCVLFSFRIYFWRMFFLLANGILHSFRFFYFLEIDSDWTLDRYESDGIIIHFERSSASSWFSGWSFVYAVVSMLSPKTTSSSLNFLVYMSIHIHIYIYLRTLFILSQFRLNAKFNFFERKNHNPRQWSKWCCRQSRGLQWAMFSAIFQKKITSRQKTKYIHTNCVHRGAYNFTPFHINSKTHSRYLTRRLQESEIFCWPSEKTKFALLQISVPKKKRKKKQPKFLSWQTHSSAFKCSFDFLLLLFFSAAFCSTRFHLLSLRSCRSELACVWSKLIAEDFILSSNT